MSSAYSSGKLTQCQAPVPSCSQTSAVNVAGDFGFGDEVTGVRYGLG